MRKEARKNQSIGNKANPVVNQRAVEIEPYGWKDREAADRPI